MTFGTLIYGRGVYRGVVAMLITAYAVIIISDPLMHDEGHVTAYREPQWSETP